MWRKKPISLTDILNPWLGVAYAIPENWTATKHDSLRGIQLLPFADQTIYPAAMILRVFPDHMNSSPDFRVDSHIADIRIAASYFEQHSRDLKIHSAGFLIASTEYTLTSNNFTRTESFHIVAFDIDGRATITAASLPDYWPYFVPIRDAFISSIRVQRPELAIKDHYQ